MTIDIQRLSGHEAYDLIYPAHLAMLPVSDQQVMHQSMANSTRVWLGWDDEKIICVWGLVPPTLLSDRAYLWLYTTQHLTSHVFHLVRHSQRMVQQMLKEFPELAGHCAIDQPKSIRWLKWLGAKFGDPQGPFLPFTIKAQQ
jgi:hypothetical protein